MKTILLDQSCKNPFPHSRISPQNTIDDYPEQKTIPKFYSILSFSFTFVEKLKGEFGKKVNKLLKDWKQILYDIYEPDIGSLWAAPNSIWKNSFAANKADTDYHPAVIGKNSPCKTNSQIIPGTSKEYRRGSCVFKVKLNANDPNYPYSHFLIDLWMTFSKSDLFKLKRGWNGIICFNEQQLKEFKLQIKFCTGIDV